VRSDLFAHDIGGKRFEICWGGKSVYEREREEKWLKNNLPSSAGIHSFAVFWF